VWIWGEVYSVTDEGGKRRSVDPNESAQVCARQYSAHGLDFVSRLDGEFTGCVYEPAADTVSFFTDRLGARPPLYYARGDDGLAFSTAVQTVPVLPGFEPAFDERFLAEYLYCRRTFGTKTPIGTRATAAGDDPDLRYRERRHRSPSLLGAPDTGPKTDRSRTSCGNSPTDSNGRSTTGRETTATTASC